MGQIELWCVAGRPDHHAERSRTVTALVQFRYRTKDEVFDAFALGRARSLEYASLRVRRRDEDEHAPSILLGEREEWREGVDPQVRTRRHRVNAKG